MKRLRFVAAIFLVPVLGIFTLSCGSSEDSTRDMPPPAKVAKKGGGKEPAGGGGGGGGGGGAAAGATELESTGSATLKGTVSFDGTPPAQTRVSITKDPEVC